MGQRKPLVFGVTISLLCFLTACSSTTQSSTPTASQQTAKVETKPEVQQGVSETDVCNSVGSAYQIYTDDFNEFRYGPSDVPWQVFYDLSDVASESLASVAGQIDNYGITWDSGAIVSSLIYSAAETINSIKQYTSDNFFPPGRDLETLLSDIDMDVSSVLNSACAG